jgi:hypothetical protein
MTPARERSASRTSSHSSPSDPLELVVELDRERNQHLGEQG